MVTSLKKVKEFLTSKMLMKLLLKFKTLVNRRGNHGDGGGGADGTGAVELSVQCGCATAQSSCRPFSGAGTAGYHQAGAMSMPITLAKLEAIGQSIRRRQTAGRHSLGDLKGV